MNHDDPFVENADLVRAIEDAPPRGDIAIPSHALFVLERARRDALQAKGVASPVVVSMDKPGLPSVLSATSDRSSYAGGSRSNLLRWAAILVALGVVTWFVLPRGTPPANVAHTFPSANVALTFPPANVALTSPPANVALTSPPANVALASPPANVALTSPTANVALTSSTANVARTSSTANVALTSPTATISDTQPVIAWTSKDKPDQKYDVWILPAEGDYLKAPTLFIAKGVKSPVAFASMKPGKDVADTALKAGIDYRVLICLADAGRMAGVPVSFTVKPAPAP